MTKDKNPLSPILIRIKQDLQFNDLEERSQESYGRAVRKFAEFLKREPETASEDDLRSYLLFIKSDLHWECKHYQRRTTRFEIILQNHLPSELAYSQTFESSWRTQIAGRDYYRRSPHVS